MAVPSALVLGDAADAARASMDASVTSAETLSLSIAASAAREAAASSYERFGIGSSVLRKKAEGKQSKAAEGKQRAR